MKKLFILSLFLLVFGNVNAVVLVAISESNLTTRENTVLGLLDGFNLSPDVLGSNPAWDDLMAYNLIVATEEGALDATMINNLITNGKKVMLLYNSGSPLGGTWTTDNVINHRYLIIENDIEVFNGYQSNIRIHMQTGNPSCHISGNLPAGWTVAGSNHYATRKTVLFRKHSDSNGKGLVYTYNPLSYTGAAKNFLALAIHWLTGDSPVEGITIPGNHVAFIITNNEYEDAEDLTETIFLKAWQGLTNYKPEGAPFTAWLYRIAHNTVVDHYRTRKINEPLADHPYLPDERESVEAQVFSQAEVEQLKQTLQEMTPIHQEVLVLRFINELSPAETAAALNKSNGAIRVLQHRALKELQALMTVGDIIDE